MSLLSPQLQAFMMIAKLHTVHGAASQLHLTQTAVTQRIRSLESQLGTTLFVRTRRGMQLTPEGEALLRYCNATQELAGSAMASIRGAAVETEVRVKIIGPSSTMRARIMPKCADLLNQFPQLILEFLINDIDSGHQRLQSGECQFALLRPEDVSKEMARKLLQSEDYILVCSPKWHGRKLKDIIKNERIIDFAPNDQMTFQYLKKYDLLELANTERHFANTPDGIANLISQGHGYSVLIKEFCAPYIASKQLMVLNHSKTYQSEIMLAWYTRPEPPAYFSSIIDAIN